MRVSENSSAIHDYAKCRNLADIERLLAELNRRGWSLICVTPYRNGTFLVFFRRGAYG